jgi:hypothetical protein
MRHIIEKLAVAIGGVLTGAIVVAGALYVWPFESENRTPIALQGIGSSADATTESFFLNITGDTVLATHGGAFPFKPLPEGIALLGNGQTPNTFALVTKFRDRPDGDIVAFGTELEIAHPGSNFLLGKIMTHTVWSIVVPGRGALHLYQTENNWSLFKQVMLPMLLSGKAFDGEFSGVNTLGPLDGYRGLVVGGTGDFAGSTGSFIEIGTLRHLTPDGSMGGLMELRVNHHRSGMAESP